MSAGSRERCAGNNKNNTATQHHRKALFGRQAPVLAVQTDTETMSIVAGNQGEIEIAVACASRFRDHATTLAEHAQPGRTPGADGWEAL